MDVVARTLGFSLTSGVNLYLTVAIMGLAARFDWVDLPSQYDVFANEWVIGGALLLYAVEFVADKIPWVDSLWDSVHTIIRPVGGAVIAAATIGDPGPGLEALAVIAGGTIAGASHLTKASTRAAANTSPEPFTNWALSFSEDAFVIGLALIALEYPIAALVITVIVLVAIIVALRWIIGRLLQAIRGWMPVRA